MADPSSSSSTPTPTVLDQLYTLLQAHQLTYPQPSPPYLHPYAPSRKGKGRAIPQSASAQLEVLRQVRETVDVAKRVLSRTAGNEDERERVKLARALKEV